MSRLFPCDCIAIPRPLSVTACYTHTPLRSWRLGTPTLAPVIGRKHSRISIITLLSRLFNASSPVRLLSRYFLNLCYMLMV